MSKSIRKPKKPHDDFPLFPHDNGLWCKKIRGHAWYFGPWHSDRKGEAALRKYIAEKDDILAGQNPRAAKAEGFTLGMCVNDYLNSKKKKMETGRLRARHFGDIHKICDRLIAFFGAGKLVENIGPADFDRLDASYPTTWKLRRRKREISGTRAVFNYAVLQEKITRTRFGDYKQPDKDQLLAERKTMERRHGNREFTPEQLRKVINAAGVPMRAMVLLGVNVGYGNTDCAELTTAYLDLENGWATFPRPKTSLDRKAALWPETVSAVREAIAQRPAPRDPADADKVFLTPTGLPWVRVETTKGDDGKIEVKVLDGLCRVFHMLLKQLKVYRPGLSFYSLRHCAETNGGTDQVAIDVLMGHATSGMGTNYRQSMSDERLKAVSSSIHSWLYGNPTELKIATETLPA